MGEAWGSYCHVLGGCWLSGSSRTDRVSISGAPAFSAPSLPPSVLCSPYPDRNLSRPFVFCSLQSGPAPALTYAPAQAAVLPPPPFPSPSSLLPSVYTLSYRHTVPLSSPVPFPSPLVSR